MLPTDAKRNVDLSFRKTLAAPQALIKAEVRYEKGQAAVTIKYDEMKPAVLFAGDVTCYVVWAVTRDGAAENLGELVVRDVKGEVTMSTGQKAFALLINLRVEGHTDSTGTPEHNQKLSEQRAQSVVAFVTEQGVEASRLTWFGYGQTRPLADNESAEGRKKNRRVEIVVAEGQIQEAAP